MEDLINENLRYIRKQLGLTQEKMAYQLGIKRSSVGAYEEKRATPPQNIVNNLSDISGVAVQDLLEKDLCEQEYELEPQYIEAVAEQAAASYDYGNNGRSSPYTNGISATSAPNEPNRKPLTNGQNSRNENTKAPDISDLLSYLENLNQPKKERQPQPDERISNRQTAAPNQRTQAQKGLLHTVSMTVEANTEQPQTHIISAKAQAEYVAYCHHPAFLSDQPVMQLPFIDNNKWHRAFEVHSQQSQDGLSAGTLVVAALVRNWARLTYNKLCVIVTAKAIIMGYIQTPEAEENELVVSTTTRAELTIHENDILEIWQAGWFISSELPRPEMPANRLTDIVMNLQQEVIKLKNK